MFIADAHCDTLYSIVALRKPASACMINAENMKRGGVCLQTFALFAGFDGTVGRPYRVGLEMLERRGEAGIPLFERELPDCVPDAPHGVLAIEGGEMIRGSLDALLEFDSVCRVRYLSLTWNRENEIGFPARARTEDGLKPFGLALLRETDRLGILPDVSHLNEAGFWDVVNHAELPPIATHSNLQSLCDHNRNLTDAQVRTIIEKKGFIGINFYPRFLAKGRPATPEDVLRHIDGIAQLGGIDVLGFGSDFDGIEMWPEGLRDPSDFPALLTLLENHGYREEDLAKIAGLNLWNVYKRAEACRK